MSYFWKSMHDSQPPSPGWYAVLVCYGIEYGAFPKAAFWDGLQWSINDVTDFGGGPLAAETEAKSLADENDPDLW